MSDQMKVDDEETDRSMNCPFHCLMYKICFARTETFVGLELEQCTGKSSKVTYE
jgi:hypothetical protein